MGTADHTNSHRHSIASALAFALLPIQLSIAAYARHSAACLQAHRKMLLWFFWIGWIGRKHKLAVFGLWKIALRPGVPIDIARISVSAIPSRLKHTAILANHGENVRFFLAVPLVGYVKTYAYRRCWVTIFIKKLQPDEDGIAARKMCFNHSTLPHLPDCYFVPYGPRYVPCA